MNELRTVKKSDIRWIHVGHDSTCSEDLEYKGGDLLKTVNDLMQNPDITAIFLKAHDAEYAADPTKTNFRICFEWIADPSWQPGRYLHGDKHQLTQEQFDELCAKKRNCKIVEA